MKRFIVDKAYSNTYGVFAVSETAEQALVFYTDSEDQAKNVCIKLNEVLARNGCDPSD